MNINSFINYAAAALYIGLEALSKKNRQTCCTVSPFRCWDEIHGDNFKFAFLFHCWNQPHNHLGCAVVVLVWYILIYGRHPAGPFTGPTIVSCAVLCHLHCNVLLCQILHCTVLHTLQNLTLLTFHRAHQCILPAPLQLYCNVLLCKTAQHSILHRTAYFAQLYTA